MVDNARLTCHSSYQLGCCCGPAGSRLPLVGDWPLREVPLPPAASGVRASDSAAAGATLLLGLALEELGMQSMRSVPPGGFSLV